MSDFITEEESFGLRLMERLPESREGECFLLYQMGAGMESSMIIRRGVKYSPTAVRHGHYNRKATLSLRSLSFSGNYRKKRNLYIFN